MAKFRVFYGFNDMVPFRSQAGVASDAPTLELARVQLQREIADTIKDCRVYDEPVRRAMLEAQASVVEPGEKLTANGVEHWIEEVE